jgi:integrase
VIPLNADAMSAILELYKRAELSNAAELDHFVFPACENGKIDPTRPQAAWRTAWRRLTQAITCPACGQLQNPGTACRNTKCGADISKVKSSLAGVRFHDLRHQAITELAESQASDQTIMAIAGHVSPKMLAHYSHIRLDAKRRVLDALVSKGSGSAVENTGYVTNRATNGTIPDAVRPQVTEEYGRPVRARTADLYRVKVIQAL